VSGGVSDPLWQTGVAVDRSSVAINQAWFGIRIRRGPFSRDGDGG
jgi:hypothetical protein